MVSFDPQKYQNFNYLWHHILTRFSHSVDHLNLIAMKKNTAVRYLGLLLTCLMVVPLSAQSDPTPSKKTRILQVDLQENINSYTWLLMQKGLQKATEENVSAVLIHMNTYGGEVVYADSIRSAILDAKLPVWVFINNNAASAGALISIACDSIYMRTGATIGASTVVDQTGAAAQDKVQSYMRGIIRATAEAQGKVTRVENGDTTEIWRRDPRIAEAMVDPDIRIESIIDTGKVLTFTANEALKHGYCDGLAESVDAVLSEHVGLDDYEVTVFTMASVDKLKGRLMGSALRAILIMIIVAGIWFELQSPGIGFPTMAAIAAAILYFAPLYLEGLAQNWEIIAFVVGALLMLAELFIIPGFGVAGVLGILLMILGLVFALVGVDFSFNTEGLNQLEEPFLLVSISIVLAILILIWITSKIGQSNSFLRKVALTKAQDKEDGYVGVPTEITTLVGKTGQTLTILKPSGKVSIEGKTYDAVAMVGFLEPHIPVVVVRHEAGQIYVRAAKAD